MSNAPTANASAVLSYQASAPPLLRHPTVASIGLMLLAIGIVLPFLWPFLRNVGLTDLYYAMIMRVYTLANMCWFPGALLVALAFRRSPLAQTRFQITMFSAALIPGILFCIATGLAFVAEYLFSPESLASVVTCVAFLHFFKSAIFAAYWIFLLVLLRRVARAIHSPIFGLASVAIVGAQVILWANLTAIGLIAIFYDLDANDPVLRREFFLIRINACRPAALFFLAFALWCIVLMRPLSKPTEPHPC